MDIILINQKQVLGLDENLSNIEERLNIDQDIFVNKTGGIIDGDLSIYGNLTFNEDFSINSDNLKINKSGNGINYIEIFPKAKISGDISGYVKISNKDYSEDAKVLLEAINTGCGIDFGQGASLFLGDRYTGNNINIDSNSEIRFTINQDEELCVGESGAVFSNSYRANNITYKKSDFIFYNNSTNEPFDSYSFSEYPIKKYDLYLYSRAGAGILSLKVYLKNGVAVIEEDEIGTIPDNFSFSVANRRGIADLRYSLSNGLEEYIVARGLTKETDSKDF